MTHEASALPGLRAQRLARLAIQTVTEVGLDLSGRTVLTEAATGAYTVTPALAALAGAQVVAVTRPSRFGTVGDVIAETRQITDLLEVSDSVTVTDQLAPEHLSAADVVTNSGHLRPLDAEKISRMRPGAVLPLMFEAWEVGAGRQDVDLDALRARHIRFAGTNERHPLVDVFSYLGPMACAALQDAGFPVYRTRVDVVCDNPFEPFLTRGLRSMGARTRLFASAHDLLRAAASTRSEEPPDAVLVAMRPTGESVISPPLLQALAEAWPGTAVVQFWGDVDRQAACDLRLPVWPASAPGPGHMAVLPSRVGPDPIVRLQAGGLKVAQVLLTSPQQRSAADTEYLDEF
jgi:RNase P/RNase MRP subunit p29